MEYWRRWRGLFFTPRGEIRLQGAPTGQGERGDTHVCPLCQWWAALSVMTHLADSWTTDFLWHICEPTHTSERCCLSPRHPLPSFFDRWVPPPAIKVRSTLAGNRDSRTPVRLAEMRDCTCSQGNQPASFSTRCTVLGAHPASSAVLRILNPLARSSLTLAWRASSAGRPW